MKFIATCHYYYHYQISGSYSLTSGQLLIVINYPRCKTITVTHQPVLCNTVNFLISQFRIFINFLISQFQVFINFLILQFRVFFNCVISQFRMFAIFATTKGLMFVFFVIDETCTTMGIKLFYILNKVL